LTKKQRKTRLWQVDPSVFQPGPKAGLFERYVLSRGRSLARYTVYTLAFAYPLMLVGLGLLFGGLVFWTSLAGSMLLIGLVIWKSGYAGNFASWDISYKKFLGLLGGLGIGLGFFFGLAYIKTWTVLIFGVVLALALVVGVWRTSKE